MKRAEGTGRRQARVVSTHSSGRDRLFRSYRYSDEFRERIAGHPRIALEYVDGAGHATYYLHDPAWFKSLLETHFEYWLEPAPPPETHRYTGVVSESRTRVVPDPTTVSPGSTRR